MNFSFSKEQTELRNAAIKFARRELADEGVHRDAEEAFSRDHWKKCADFGIQGMPFPTAIGGRGKDIVSTILVLDTLGYVRADSRFAFAVGAQMWGVQAPVNEFGSTEQKSRFLVPLCDGTRIGARATTAEGLRAQRDADGYILNGSQSFAPHAMFADVLLVFASSGQDVDAFLVERDTPGLHVGNDLDTTGQRAASFVFENCRVTVANRLGAEGQGAEVLRRSMEWERGSIFAPCVGAMQRRLEASLEHARTHERLGQPIGKSQTVANYLVDMRTRWETSRWLLYQMAWMKQRDGRAAMESAVAELHIGESWLKNCLDSVQVFGDSPKPELERDLYDAVRGALYPGTAEIQRNLIARQLGV